MQEKYGFVYIWRDKKHNRYYVGSHWGTIDDGYVCSSPWMLQAYKLRPRDFKRRIIKIVNTNRYDLLNEEFKYLSLIKDEEIKTKYYNLNTKSTGHWSAYPEKVKTVREKISHKTKEAMQRPEVRAKYEEGLKQRDNRSSNLIVREKRREAMIKTMAEKFPEENRHKALTKEERKEYYSQKAKDIWSNRTDEQLKEVGQKISEGLKGKQNRLGHTNSKEHRKKISEAQKGKIHPRHKISINGAIYDSTHKAAENLNISVATINRRIKNNKYDKYYRLGLDS